MSYSAHSLRRLFTQGQVERMTATLLAQYPLVWHNPRVYWPDETPVQPPVPQPEVTISINPEDVPQGQNCMVSWTSKDATEVEGIGFTAHSLNGSTLVKNIQQDTAVAIIGRNGNNEARANASISVILPEPPKPKITIDAPETMKPGEEVIIRCMIENANWGGIEIQAGADGESLWKFVKLESEDVDPNLIAHFKQGDFDISLGWKDSVSGRYAQGSGMPTFDEGVSFTRQQDGLQFDGLEWQDYTVEMRVRFLQPPSDVRGIISKRDNNSALGSHFFLFTWSNNGNRLTWDNTNASQNRIDTGVLPQIAEEYTIMMSRDNGIYVDDYLVAAPQTPDKTIVNTSPLRIGNDHTATGRVMQGVIYEIKVWNISK
jgi:hypothetical protein